MEIFFAREVSQGECRLDPEESAHLVRVLRHRAGDEVNVTDGDGTLYRCILKEASPKEAVATIVEILPDWAARPYTLTMAVCPTKNQDRFEWFCAKATEIGVDRIVPIIGEHSERRIFKTDRVKKILLSSTKQSLKAKVPKIDESVSVENFLKGLPDEGGLRLIAHCMEDGGRKEITDVLYGSDSRDITVMIGPEGDFSRGEVEHALGKGFIPVSLGESRLRVETAAVLSVGAVYLSFLGEGRKKTDL